MRYILIILYSLFLISPSVAQRIQRSQSGFYGIAVSKSNGDIKWIAKPKYSKIEKNPYEGFTVCNEAGKWGVISSGGKELIECKHTTKDKAEEAFRYYINPELKNYATNVSIDDTNNSNPDFTLTRDYSRYIREFVENKIKEWQKKGEFEKTSDYQKRVTESTRNAMVNKLTKDVCDEILQKVRNKELRMKLEEYDADNETFLINTAIGNFVLPVTISKAPDFKKNWPQIVSENTYDIVNGKIILRSSSFSYNKRIVASYNDKSHSLYARANVEYNFDPIEVPLNNGKELNQPKIIRNDIKLGKSDVDMNIPSTNSNNKNTFALIFANENYREEVPVLFAKNDGESVSKYFTQTLGIPQNNVHLINDATKNDFIREIDWLKKVGKAYDNNISILIYYAGHGVPDEQNGSSYLIPIDGVGNNVNTLFSLSDFYKELDEIEATSKIIFLDACFSGAVRGNGMLASARGVALKAKKQKPTENMIILTASQDDETAWPYEEKNHGLFTYFLLKKLQESKGNASIGSLFDYISNEVGRHSIVVNSKKQTPSVHVSSNLSDKWKQLKLKN